MRCRNGCWGVKAEKSSAMYLAYCLEMLCVYRKHVPIFFGHLCHSYCFLSTHFFPLALCLTTLSFTKIHRSHSLGRFIVCHLYREQQWRVLQELSFSFVKNFWLTELVPKKPSKLYSLFQFSLNWIEIQISLNWISLKGIPIFLIENMNFQYWSILSIS